MALMAAGRQRDKSAFVRHLDVFSLRRDRWRKVSRL